MSSSISLVLPQVVSFLHGFSLLPHHLLGFMSEIDKTITIRSLSMPRRPYIVLLTDDAFLSHVFDDEKVRTRVLEPFEVSVMISNVVHPLFPVCNTVVRILEGHMAEDADRLWWRAVRKEVRDGVGDIGIDLSRMVGDTAPDKLERAKKLVTHRRYCWMVGGSYAHARRSSGC